MTTFKARCIQFLGQLNQNAILRQGDPVADLMAFVTAETGRSADQSLEPTLPLCLYFSTTEDREEFITLMHAAKPGMITKRMP